MKRIVVNAVRHFDGLNLDPTARGSHRGILLTMKQQQNFHKDNFRSASLHQLSPLKITHILDPLFFFFYQYFGLIHIVGSHDTE